MVLVTILVLPLLGGTAIAVGRGRRASAWVAVATNGATLVLGIVTAVRVVRTARSQAHGGCCGPTP